MSVENEKVCCNCRHNIRHYEDEGGACYCDIDNHYIGYNECMTGWCRHWAKDKEVQDGTTVEVVIRIPKYGYDYMIANPTRYNVCDDETLLYNYIKNGTVLPKGHGRLIDADAINIHDVSPAYGMEVYGVTQDDIEYEPTVIEADKEVDNG